MKAEDVNPALMLMVVKVPKLLLHAPSLNQSSGVRRAMILNEDRVIPELHLTGNGENTGSV